MDEEYFDFRKKPDKVEISQREFEALLSRMQELEEHDRKYGNNYWLTMQNALKALSASYKNWYDLGYSQGINVRRKIADETIEKYMSIEIRKNPKISLKKFAEKYGYLKEEEESK